MPPKIRLLQESDNIKMATVIKMVLVEHGAPKTGTAYEDEALKNLFKVYKKEKSAYYVVEEAGEILGGAGIAPLEKGAATICELQKMYFLTKARGRGLGVKMMEKCIDFAKESGFEQVYLETLPYMQNARKLYKRSGFKALNAPLGDTGHYNCSMWMLRDI